MIRSKQKEPKMKNEYLINKKYMMSRAKDFHLYRGKDVFAVILWSLLALIEIACVSLLLQINGDVAIIIFGIVITLLCIYKLFFERFVIMSRRYKMLSKMYGVEEWTHSIELSDEDIVVTDYNRIERYRYETVTKCVDRNDYVVILINNSIGISVYKNSFTSGSWEECLDLINSKINK